MGAYVHNVRNWGRGIEILEPKFGENRVGICSANEVLSEQILIASNETRPLPPLPITAGNSALCCGASEHSAQESVPSMK